MKTKWKKNKIEDRNNLYYNFKQFIFFVALQFPHTKEEEKKNIGRKANNKLKIFYLFVTFFSHIENTKIKKIFFL